MSGDHGQTPRGFAAALTRALLALYPPSFRREAMDPLLDDVRRRDADLTEQGVGKAGWIVRLTFSLLLNVPGAWIESLHLNRRSARRRRERWARVAGRRPSGPGIGGRPSSFSWLDIKLGLRMLLKHPGLTLAGSLGIAVAIGASAGFFAFSYALFYPEIPLDEGHRIVGLENWDIKRGNEHRRSVHDYYIWRDEMRSVEDMSAFRTESRNLTTGDGQTELVRFAEMTPAGFELARVPPFLGRTLVAADAAQGAPNVMVIGYDVWRTRFTADPNIIGRDVRLGGEVHTIVGVMPKGFAFPMNHSFWIPFRHQPTDFAMGEGPSIFISGRLAPGYTMADAKAELALIGERMAAEYPETHGNFRAQLMPYAYPLLDVNQGAGEDILPQFILYNGFISLLLVLVGLNVAVLIYARTATRRGEIAVRTALGAARSRIIAQLCAEALVLSLLGAGLGLGLAKVGLGLGNGIMKAEMGEVPFWMDLGVPWPAVVYTLALTVFVATVTGVLPGLQATGQRVSENLRRYSNGTGLRLGRTWTALIVLQVSVTVTGLPLAVAMGWSEVSSASTLPLYETDDFLLAFLVPDQGGLSNEEWYTARERLRDHLVGTRDEVMRRIAARPGVTSVSRAWNAPRGAGGFIVLDAAGGADESDDRHRVRWTPVDAGYFGTLDVGIRAGRAILPGDAEEGALDVAVVDQTFVDRLLGGGDPLGRRVRMVPREPDPAERERWYEIVGVAENMHQNVVDQGLLNPHVYLSQKDVLPAGFMVRAEGMDVARLVQPIEAAVARLDPTIRVASITLSETYRQERLALMLVAFVLALIAAAVLMLSAAGIYALMSFTVSQRRREIGIRTALGAQPGRLLGGIFRRALAQLGAGLGLGVAILLIVDLQTGGEALQGYGSFLITVMVFVMTAVGLLATLGPARRGLGVAPAEALRSE